MKRIIIFLSSIFLLACEKEELFSDLDKLCTIDTVRIVKTDTVIANLKDKGRGFLGLVLFRPDEQCKQGSIG